MRKVFLDDLPRLRSKSNKEKINWKESIGFRVRFVHDNVESEVEIIERCDNDNLIIKYKNKIFTIKTYNLTKCKLNKVLGKMTKEFKIEIDTHLKDNKRDLVIIDREYRDRADNKGNNKWYKYKCNKCGWAEGWIVEGNIIKGQGCSCCSNPPKSIVLGINTIWDNARWMCNLGVSEEDAKKHTRSSGKKIKVKCPDCGKVKEKTINDICNKKSIGCVCNSKYSYPEKFIYSMLKQLNINFETQYSPDYIKPKRSDFYLPDYKLTIEADGRLGHKGGIVHSKSNKTLEELIEIDIWKDAQHLKHGLKTIRINCFKSDMEYIKNSILNSELDYIFDLSKIDWNKCEEFALKNMVKEVCDYWNIKKDWETNKDLSIKFNFDSATIRTYLKKGTCLGWCVYDGKKEITKNTNRLIEINKERCSKRVQIFKNGDFLGEFKSTSELERQSEKIFGIKLDHSKIGMVAKGDRIHHKGFTFKYVD